MNQRFAPHELLELHEFLTNEVLATQKSQVFGPSVTDSEVWNFMQKCSSAKQKRLQECQSIIGHNVTGAGSHQYGGTTGGYTAGHTGVSGRGEYSFGGYGGYGHNTDKRH